MSGIFTFEATLKIITFGFLMNGSKSYLRDPANMLDFFIVVSALISLSSEAEIGFLKTLRTVRVLRPFRLVGRLKKLGIVI